MLDILIEIGKYGHNDCSRIPTTYVLAKSHVFSLKPLGHLRKATAFQYVNPKYSLDIPNLAVPCIAVAYRSGSRFDYRMVNQSAPLLAALDMVRLPYDF